MSNSVSIKSENSSKMYSVKLSCFEKLIERELNSYLKHLNSLGCLSVSVREARAAVSSGVAVSVPSKKCGRPRKSIRKVDDKDIIADLTAKANDDSCEKPVSHDEKAVAKAAKLAAKEKAKAEKLAAKKKAKAEKLAAKEQEKAAKKAAKAALKAEKAAKAKKELERKTKEAKELKKKFNMDKAKAEHTELVEEEILNEKGEVVGSKVAGFNVPPQKKIIEDEKDQHEEFELPEGFEIFQHQSRPNETLYKDDSDDVFAKSGGELQHIAHYDSASNNLLQLSDSDSDEEELGELSDTE